MSGQCDNGNVTGHWVGFEPARCLPAVNHREIEVHQNDIGMSLSGLRTSSFTVLGHNDFKPVQHLEPHFQHVAIAIVILHVEDSGHATLSGTFSDWRAAATRSRTLSTRSAGRNCSLSRTVSIPEFNRARSSMLRSRAVMTITG